MVPAIATRWPPCRGESGMIINKLGVVARVGIEPSTRRFSLQGRGVGDARKPKTGKGFRGPDRTALPDRAYSELRRPGPSELCRKRKKRRGVGASRPNGDRNAALHRRLAWRLNQTHFTHRQAPIRVFFTRATNSRWASACPSLTDHRSTSSRSTTCCAATRTA